VPLWLPAHYPEEVEHAADAGITLTGGAVDVKGTWTALITSTVRDAYGIWLQANGLSITATATPGLVDIGVGPTTPEIIVPDWNVGYCFTAGAAAPILPKMQFFPCFIPAGTKVWARFAGLSADTVIIYAALEEAPPFGGVSPGDIKAYGVVVSGSKGTNVTPGAAAWGTAVQLSASTTKEHRYWAVGLGGAADATLLNHLRTIHCRLAMDSAGTAPFGNWVFDTETTTEIIGGPFPPYPVYQPVPAGSTLYCQLNADVATDLFDVIAYGMG
jgi:hypothetical protein